MILLIQLVILILLIMLFCGDGGSRAIVTTVFNGLVILASLHAMYAGAPPLAACLLACLATGLFAARYQFQGAGQARLALASVVALIVLILPLILWITSKGNFEGFSPQEYEITDTNGFGRNIDLNMFQLSASVMIIALTGSLTDMAIGISAVSQELKAADATITFSLLFTSTLRVGRAVLNTSIHTIFYIFLGEYLTLFIQYVSDYDWGYVINSKSFTSEFATVSICAIGLSLILPVSALLSSWSLTRHQSNNK